MFQVSGAFLFGAAEKLEEFIRDVDNRPKVVILRFRKIIAMDATGVQALARLHQHLRKHRKWLVLAGVLAQPLEVMTKSGFLEQLGEENLCADIDMALARGNFILANSTRKMAAFAG